MHTATTAHIPEPGGSCDKAEGEFKGKAAGRGGEGRPSIKCTVDGESELEGVEEPRPADVDPHGADPIPYEALGRSHGRGGVCPDLPYLHDTEPERPCDCEDGRKNSWITAGTVER
eukprot:766195-Hanusia_phi.AAC.10